PELLTTEMLVLRNANIPVVSFDKYINIEISHSILPDYSTISPKGTGAALVLERIDLTGLQEIIFSPPATSDIKDLEKWNIEVRIDDIHGELIGSANEVLTKDGKVGLRAELIKKENYHDLYFVFVNKNADMEDVGRFKIWRVKFVQ
ncbi:MAG TPA: hypothetical protein VLZ54_05105, partial [Arenibacter sp.]|nr:hypothetical protein [Arenibacter sp.]